MKQGYTGLEVWVIGMELAEAVYRATEGFPSGERFGLSSQMRRAAVSIVSNIAEGHGRRSRREFRRFVDIAYGSLLELETQIKLSERLGFLSAENSQIAELAARTGRLLNGFRRSLIAIPTN